MAYVTRAELKEVLERLECKMATKDDIERIARGLNKLLAPNEQI